MVWYVEENTMTTFFVPLLHCLSSCSPQPEEKKKSVREKYQKMIADGEKRSKSLKVQIKTIRMIYVNSESEIILLN